MGRDQALHYLDQHIKLKEAVILGSSSAPASSSSPQFQVIADVRTRCLGSDHRTGSGSCSSLMECHQDALARSPFANVGPAL